MAINVSNHSIALANSQARTQSAAVSPAASQETPTTSQAEPNMVSLSPGADSENEQDWAAAGILRRKAFAQKEESIRSNSDTSYTVQSPKGGWGAYGWAGKMIAASQAELISSQTSPTLEPGNPSASAGEKIGVPEAAAGTGKGVDANGNILWNEPSRIATPVKLPPDLEVDPQRNYSPRDWTPDGYQLPQPGTVRTDDFQVHQVAPGVWVDDNWNQAAPPVELDLDGNPILRAYPVTGLPNGWTIEERTGDVLDQNGQPVGQPRPVADYDPGPFVPGDWTYDPGTLGADGTFLREPGTVLDGNGMPLGTIPDGVSSWGWRSWLMDHPNFMAGWGSPPVNTLVTTAQEDPINQPGGGELPGASAEAIGPVIAPGMLGLVASQLVAPVDAQSIGPSIAPGMLGLLASQLLVPVDAQSIGPAIAPGMLGNLARQLVATPGSEEAGPEPEAQVVAQEAEPLESQSERPVEPFLYESF